MGGGFCSSGLDFESLCNVLDASFAHIFTLNIVLMFEKTDMN